MEAGVEHFGRGVEKNVDAVIVIVDPTSESFSVVERVTGMSWEMGIGKIMAVLNKVDSPEIESFMVRALGTKIEILGVIHADESVSKAGLMGTPIGDCKALEEMETIIDRLEATL